MPLPRQEGKWMIAPKKPSRHTASQRPLSPTTDNSPDSEFKTDSQAGIVPATENVSEIGTLDTSSLSQLRQFFELLDRLDRQRAREAVDETRRQSTVEVAKGEAGAAPKLPSQHQAVQKVVVPVVSVSVATVNPEAVTKRAAQCEPTWPVRVKGGQADDAA
jgi:hypothetical protein